ncbi:AEC family transporter [Streptomyces gamaensis]|uniref:AEC family transporter n=1 Tax=Streptomyces gamaensis TaxID=1763542 RepID=A0ABW0ZAR4_9ACTN
MPASLFTGMVTMRRETLLSDIPLAVAVVVPMLAGYLLVFGVARLVFRRDTAHSAIVALTVGFPSTVFMGTVVLGYLYGTQHKSVDGL